jgi:hypothetical protein
VRASRQAAGKRQRLDRKIVVRQQVVPSVAKR